MSVTCAAIDLGATSGRVSVGEYADRKLTVTEVHRFPNQFRTLGGSAYWDIPTLWAEVQRGLLAAKKQFPKLASVGVDTWGVDYALLDDDGRLVFPIHSYRDARTQAGLRALRKQGIDRIYTHTGIPNVFYNTSLQLQACLQRHPAVRRLATRCLFLPDYFNFLLSGRAHNEISIASTAQLLDVHSDTWSATALRHFKVPSKWFTKPIKAGAILGAVKGFPELKDVRVIVAPGHDTAAAYDAMPAAPDGSDAYLSSGTWSLVGFEHDQPLLGPRALKAGIANGRTGDGRFTPLKNVIGLWLLEQTLRDFPKRPSSDQEWSDLISEAEKLPPPARLLDVADPAFASPPSMRAAIDAHLKKRRSSSPKNLPGYTRLICASLGQGHADAVRTFETLSGRKFHRLLMVGGGSRNRLLCQATADAAGIPVVSFELEGSTVGNLATQLIALRAVPDLATFRAHLAAQLRQHTFTPSVA